MSTCVLASIQPVYPRVGGGNNCIIARRSSISGLSPRGRGKRHLSGSPCRILRSIPAWAGETSTCHNRLLLDRVYPRVGGGKRRRNHRRQGDLRSIPAWAGETAGTIKTYGQKAVYPRVGGGNFRLNGDNYIVVGLSPRGRGKRHHRAERGDGAGSIPAWAGETAAICGLYPVYPVYPRVGGGNAFPLLSVALAGGLSPRGRGKRIGSTDGPGRSRSIPAWAGETMYRLLKWANRGVYPRVGGGNGDGWVATAGGQGLSPRGRGKPRWAGRCSIRVGSIPAWAGETTPMT